MVFIRVYFCWADALKLRTALILLIAALRARESERSAEEGKNRLTETSGRNTEDKSCLRLHYRHCSCPPRRYFSSDVAFNAPRGLESGSLPALPCAAAAMAVDGGEEAFTSAAATTTPEDVDAEGTGGGATTEADGARGGGFEEPLLDLTLSPSLLPAMSGAPRSL